ncbi:MAG: hypothetical protein M1838_005498, partial [Thelocarpon superellum]
MLPLDIGIQTDESPHHVANQFASAANGEGWAKVGPDSVRRKSFSHHPNSTDSLPFLIPSITTDHRVNVETPPSIFTLSNHKHPRLRKMSSYDGCYLGDRIPRAEVEWTTVPDVSSTFRAFLGCDDSFDYLSKATIVEIHGSGHIRPASAIRLGLPPSPDFSRSLDRIDAVTPPPGLGPHIQPELLEGHDVRTLHEEHSPNTAYPPGMPLLLATSPRTIEAMIPIHRHGVVLIASPRPSTTSTATDDAAQLLKLKASFPWLTSDLPSVSGGSSASSSSPMLAPSAAPSLGLADSPRGLAAISADAVDEMANVASPNPPAVPTRFKVKLRRRAVLPPLLANGEINGDGEEARRPAKFRLRKTTPMSLPPAEPSRVGRVSLQHLTATDENLSIKSNEEGEIEDGGCGSFARRLGKRFTPWLTTFGSDESSGEACAADNDAPRGRHEEMAVVPPTREVQPSEPRSCFSDDSSHGAAPQMRIRMSSLRTKISHAKYEKRSDEPLRSERTEVSGGSVDAE